MENPFKKTVNENTSEIENNTNVNLDTDKNNDLNNQENNDSQQIQSEIDDVKTDKTESTDDKNTEKNDWQVKYEQLNNQYIRLAADFDNFRKRQTQERENLLKYGAETTIKKLLEVVDNFERGLKAIETVDDSEKIKECYKLAYKNFNDVLGKLGVEVIKAEGEEFDPNVHEAVMQTPTNDKPENTVIAELQKGYKLGDKVLRPTLVNVATAE